MTNCNLTWKRKEGEHTLCLMCSESPTRFRISYSIGEQMFILREGNSVAHNGLTISELKNIAETKANGLLELGILP